MIPARRHPSLPDIVLTSRTRAGRLLSHPSAKDWVKHVISLGDWRSGPPAGFYRTRAATIRLEFDDIETARNPAGYVGCTEEDVVRLVAFCERIAANPAPVLVHCAAGISRSSASTLVLLSVLLGEDGETLAVEHLAEVRRWSAENNLRDSTDQILPNRRIVRFADRLLKRDGRLLAACEDKFAYRHPLEDI